MWAPSKGWCRRKAKKVTVRVRVTIGVRGQDPRRGRVATGAHHAEGALEGRVLCLGPRVLEEARKVEEERLDVNMYASLCKRRVYIYVTSRERVLVVNATTRAASSSTCKRGAYACVMLMHMLVRCVHVTIML